MNPVEFLNTIYLGDRGCKGISIDGWNASVSIKIDQISRIRSKTGTWDFYNDEDIINGLIVLTGVSSVALDPPGPLPNDYVELVEVKPTDKNDFIFIFLLGAVDQNANTREVRLRVTAKSVHLEDPSRPDMKITE